MNRLTLLVGPLAFDYGAIKIAQIATPSRFSQWPGLAYSHRPRAQANPDQAFKQSINPFCWDDIQIIIIQSLTLSSSSTSSLSSVQLGVKNRHLLIKNRCTFLLSLILKKHFEKYFWRQMMRCGGVGVGDSVTKWPEGLLDIWPYETMTICPIPYKFAKVSLIFCQVSNKTINKLSRYQSGNIAQKLVTVIVAWSLPMSIKAIETARACSNSSRYMQMVFSEGLTLAD